MIDLYFRPTPNGWKVSIMLEECGLDYRMPAIVHHDVCGPPSDAQRMVLGPTAQSTGAPRDN